jgi:hypothetical protein
MLVLQAVHKSAPQMQGKQAQDVEQTHLEPLKYEPESFLPCRHNGFIEGGLPYPGHAPKTSSSLTKNLMPYVVQKERLGTCFTPSSLILDLVAFS